MHGYIGVGLNPHLCKPHKHRNHFNDLPTRIWDILTINHPSFDLTVTSNTIRLTTTGNCQRIKTISVEIKSGGVTK